MPGARCTHSPACEVGSAHGSSPQVHRDHPAFPHAMVLTASFALSPVTGLFCHRHPRINACQNPVGPTCLRELDASVGASGPHDFAVRSNRLSSACSVSLTDSKESALRSFRALNAAASIASRPNVRDDGQRPSSRDGMRKVLDVIWGE